MKVILIIFFFVLKFCLIAQSQTEEERKFLDSLKMRGSYLLGKSLPPFALKNFKGKRFSNKDLNNRITFINLWYESCPPCIAEMNALENLYKDFKQDKNFQFLSITFEKKATIAKISKKYKMTYPIISTTVDSLHYLNFKKGFPTSIIIDTQGKIVFFTVGGTLTPSEADSNFKTNIYPLLESLLERKQ